MTAVRDSVEFLVVGGGPVGSAVALELHRAGREVLLVDAGASPDKVCGEGLLPPGWDAMRNLGVANLIEEKAPITGIAYQKADLRTGALRSIRAGLSRPSHGVRREVLCDAFARAGVAAGLEAWRPAKLRALEIAEDHVRAEIQGGRDSSLRCRYLIGADGLHSLVRRQAGLQSDRPRSFARWGTRVYLRDSSQSDVTVTLGDGVESYLTPLGGDLHGLAFIWYPERLGRPLSGDGPTWKRLLDRFAPSFRETLPSDSAFFGEDRAIGPLQQRVVSPLHRGGRVALVGDAAGYLDAITGEGLCLGMLQAAALSKLLLDGRVLDYPRRHRAIKFQHTIVVTGLLRLLSHPGMRERLFRGLHQAPALFQAVIATAVEHQSPSGLLHPDVFRFVRAFLG